MSIKLAASITSASILNLEETIKELELAKIDVIHFDIEDGAFVPQLNSGIKVIEQLRNICKLPFDVHLMVNNPEWLIPQLAKYEINMLSVHYEACPYPRRTLRIIQDHGIKAGLAFNPKTDFPTRDYFSPFLDFILALSTEPEVGQPVFIPSVLEKIAEHKAHGWPKKIQWEIDGGINKDNLARVLQSEVDLIVIGRGIFENGGISSNIQGLKEMIHPGLGRTEAIY